MKEISKQTLKSLYATAQEREKQELEAIYGVEFFNEKEILDTWEKIVAFVNDPMRTVLPYENPVSKIQRKLNAAFKMDLIAEVRNEGWVADWNNSNQYKYAAWFEKTKGGWFACGYALYFFFNACAGVGPYFKSEELTLEVQKQFFDIYLDLVP